MAKATTNNQRNEKQARQIHEGRQPATKGLHHATAQSLRVAQRELREWGLSRDERMRRALPVLLAARKAVVLDGAQPIDAIQEAGEAGVACHYARQALLSVVAAPTLQAWQADPAVLGSDRTRAFDRAIRLCRRSDARRGGWCVSRPVRLVKAGGR